MSEEWNKVCFEVVKQMSMHVNKYVTPISCVLSDEHGDHLGTGAYIEYSGNNYLITNEHVACHIEKTSITHKFLENENIYRLRNPFLYLPYPIDVAISKIDNEVWENSEHKSLAIPYTRFAKKHDTVKNELLFFSGYSGERSKFIFGSMNTCGTPYLTQETPLPNGVEEVNSDVHFSLFYNPEGAISVDGSSSLPDPHGFSGSLVWDTKYVDCMKEGKTWSPELAVVTGIVWAWPSSSACILATKVEYFHMDKMVNRMA